MEQKKIIPIIDYLKAFAISMVCITHFFSYDQKDFFVFSYCIQMGMPLFMLLSGYTTALSNERRGLYRLRELYAPAQIKRHLRVILPPYILAFLLELLLSRAWLQGGGLSYYLGSFVTGGLNGGKHGGYFFCVYWQYLLCAPLLYQCLKKHPRLTLLAALLLNMLYEWLVGAVDIPKWFNRLLFVRYLFITVFGQYFCLHRESVRLPAAAALGAASLAYITAIDYFDFHSPLAIYWTNTCVYASFYYIAVVVFAFHFFANRKLPPYLHRAIAAVGMSTWYIYLMQMLFFRLKWRRELRMLPFFWQIVVGVGFCLLAGSIWHSMDGKRKRNGGILPRHPFRKKPV